MRERIAEPLPPGFTEKETRRPLRHLSYDERETLRAAANYIQSPEVRDPRLIELAAKLRAMAGHSS